MEMDVESVKNLMYSWIGAYEKAILSKHFGLSKLVLDEAYVIAVEEWTDRLFLLDKIKEIKGREFQSIEECIQHHIENLKKAGFWKDSNSPILEKDIDNDNVILVSIPKCEYFEPCKKTIAKEDFQQHNFPCKRIGCFVGAAKKYISTNVIPEKKRNDISYFMIDVHKEEGCKGVILVNDGFLMKMLINEYVDQLEESEEN